MKFNKPMLKHLIFVLTLAAACTPGTEGASSEVSVKVETPILQGSGRVESSYELSEGACRIAWQAVSEKKADTIEVRLVNRSECELPFSEAAMIHEKVMARVLKDHSPSSIKSLATGGLKTLQPDGSWNLLLVKAAEESADYQDYLKSYPNHASKKTSNEIIADLLREIRPHAPFVEMLGKLNLHVELGGVEKVFHSKNERGQTTVIDDAGFLWWKPLQG